CASPGGSSSPTCRERSGLHETAGRPCDGRLSYTLSPSCMANGRFGHSQDTVPLAEDFLKWVSQALADLRQPWGRGADDDRRLTVGRDLGACRCPTPSRALTRSALDARVAGGSLFVCDARLTLGC